MATTAPTGDRAEVDETVRAEVNLQPQHAARAMRIAEDHDVKVIASRVYADDAETALEWVLAVLDISGTAPAVERYLAALPLHDWPSQETLHARTPLVLELAASACRFIGVDDPDRVGRSVWEALLDPTGESLTLFNMSRQDAMNVAAVRWDWERSKEPALKRASKAPTIPAEDVIAVAAAMARALANQGRK